MQRVLGKVLLGGDDVNLERIEGVRLALQVLPEGADPGGQDEVSGCRTGCQAGWARVVG
jgi:hypothetical protein